MQAYIGKQILLGIRPEDMKLSTIAEPGQQRIEAIAERVEPLGAETHLHLVSAAHSFVARVQSGDGIVLNGKISLVVAMQNAHFFDPTTEKAIGQ
jgi:multiple sugar transport system ATP-binding protein